jgi:hypothetical protein
MNNMPWITHYEPAPKDMNLPVRKDLPDGVTERKWTLSHLREAHGIVGDDYLTFHYCDRCEGWIEGHANEYRVNTLDSSHLAGRQGTEYFCRRCGEEIAFSGLMS